MLFHLYPRPLDIPSKASSLAKEKNFEVKMYKIAAADEQTRPPRLVKIAVVQNAIVRPTTDPIKDQVILSFENAHINLHCRPSNMLFQNSQEGYFITLYILKQSGR